jgi:hypothetical protein
LVVSRSATILWLVLVLIVGVIGTWLIVELIWSLFG